MDEQTKIFLKREIEEAKEKADICRETIIKSKSENLEPYEKWCNDNAEKAAREKDLLADCLEDYIYCKEAWSKVLQELEEEKEYSGNTLYQRKAYKKAIDIIHKYLDNEKFVKEEEGEYDY